MRPLENAPPKFCNEIPSDAFILLGCYAIENLGTNKLWGICALQRGDFNRDKWSVLFSLAGKGGLSDAVVAGVDYLKWTAIHGAVVIHEGQNALLDARVTDALDDELVKGCVVSRFFDKQEPVIESSLFSACAAIYTAQNTHDWVKEMQEAGRAFKLA